MSSISSIGGSSQWQTTSAQRPPHARMQEKILAKMDEDGSGGVSQSEFQTAITDIASKTGVSNDKSAEELFSTADSDGDGSLSADELGTAMQSVMPPPPSTLAFAQSRSASSAQDSGSDEMFAKLDTDGDGTLSQAEFEAGRPDNAEGTGGTGGPQAMGGMPPPPPPGGVKGSDASSETTDPLDTNGDGVVSAAERAAGEEADPIQALMDALDADQDGQVSQTEVDSFVQQLSAQLEAAAKEYTKTANGTSSTTSTGSTLSTTA